MEQVEVLRYALRVLSSIGVEYMVVGSAASMAYGEPRMTRDIDVVLDLKSEQVDALCAAFPAPEYYVSRKAAVDAVVQRSQFNVIHIPTSNKIDMILVKNDAWGARNWPDVECLRYCQTTTRRWPPRKTSSSPR